MGHKKTFMLLSEAGQRVNLSFCRDRFNRLNIEVQPLGQYISRSYPIGKPIVLPIGRNTLVDVIETLVQFSETTVIIDNPNQVELWKSEK